MRRALGLLLFVPCIGMCGLFGVQQAITHSTTKERKAEGERFVAALDGGAAPKAPEHFTYRPLPDGGYVFYFAEPAFFVPTDFFYVWDPAQRRWNNVEAGDLSLLLAPSYE